MSKLITRIMPIGAMLALSAGLTLIAQDAPKPTSPSVLYKTEPHYTEEAKAAKISGSVLLKVTVDVNGTAQDITVAKSLDPGLDQQAVEAVKQWRFAPGTLNGKPVSVAANIEVNFKLQ